MCNRAEYFNGQALANKYGISNEMIEESDKRYLEWLKEVQGFDFA